MNAASPRVVAAFLVAAVIACGVDAQCASDDPQQDGVLTVRAQEIPARVQILGRLGQPLGSLINIRGTWVNPQGIAKDGSLRFLVTHVNGQQLDEPVELNRAQIEVARLAYSRGESPQKDQWDWRFDSTPKSRPPVPAAGETWEMSGIEMGCFDSYSGAAARALGLDLVQMPYYRGGFYTHFEYVAVRKLK